MTRRRKIIIGGGVALVILILLPVWAHYRAKGALAAYKQQLQAQGEKLTIEELIPPLLTNGPNGTFALAAAAGRLPELNHEINPWGMKYLSPGRARVAWKQETLPRGNVFTNLWPQLRLELERNRETMNEIKIALAIPVIVFDLDYRQGSMMRLPHLGLLRHAAQWLAAATLLELHEGHADAAWESLRTTMATTRCLADEPQLDASHCLQGFLGNIAVSWLARPTTRRASNRVAGYAEAQFDDRLPCFGTSSGC